MLPGCYATTTTTTAAVPTYPIEGAQDNVVPELNVLWVTFHHGQVTVMKTGRHAPL